VSVCDAFHAMTTPRSYQPTFERDAALAELRRCAGSQFDPVVVDAFCALAAEPPSAARAAEDPAQRPHAHERG
jgi:HD-GYP domain-containing protein (c-di-GMP phosphodiesterase class II)